MSKEDSESLFGYLQLDDGIDGERRNSIICVSMLNHLRWGDNVCE